jgi:predicted flap endonuclease-1-like 5' DNA nuclease
MWHNGKTFCRQLEGVGPAITVAFVKAKIFSFDELFKLDSRQIEMIANRNPPFGIEMI